MSFFEIYKHLILNKFAMKIISFLFLFLLFSCTTAKFHTMDDAYDMTTRLKGKVKSLETTSFPNIKDDTIGENLIRNFYFDKKYLLKEQYSSGKVSNETVYKYNSKGLIETSITKWTSNSTVGKAQFEYDKKKNCINIKNFVNDTLRTIITSKYDHKNNIIYKEHQELKGINSWRETYSYDYKKRICLLKSFDANNKEKKSILEFKYDKRGNIIKIDLINPVTKKNSSMSFDFDKFGNQISYLSLDDKNNIKVNNIIKNEYDRKGNLIKSETFEKGNLIDTTIFDITYW